MQKKRKKQLRINIKMKNLNEDKKNYLNNITFPEKKVNNYFFKKWFE